MSSSECKDVIDWRDIDPTDPQRYLAGIEHNFVEGVVIVNNLFFMEEIPDMDKFQDCWRKLLESFPCLVSDVELMPNGTYRYKPQPIKVPDMKKLLDEAPTVCNNKELIKMVMSVCDSYKLHDPIGLSPHFVKIDVEKSVDCSAFRGKYKLVLHTTCNHVLVDGTSALNIPRYINKLYADPDYKIPMKAPQIVTNDTGLLIPDEGRTDDYMKNCTVPPFGNNGYFNSSHEHPPSMEGREILFATKVIPPGQITRFPSVKTRLTSQFVGVHAFLVLALNLHQHPDQDNLKVVFGQPRLSTFEWLNQPFPDPIENYFGHRVVAIVSTFEADRQKGFSIYKLSEECEENVQKTHNKKYEFTFMRKLNEAKRIKYGDINKSTYRHRISNVGRSDLGDGIIKFTYGFGSDKKEYGSLHFCPIGQPDGSILFLMDGDNGCFTQEFVDYFLDVYYKLWLLAKEHDVTYFDLIKMPEYTILCELLDVKMPDWMKKQ